VIVCRYTCARESCPWTEKVAHQRTLLRTQLTQRKDPGEGKHNSVEGVLMVSTTNIVSERISPLHSKLTYESWRVNLGEKKLKGRDYSRSHESTLEKSDGSCMIVTRY